MNTYAIFFLTVLLSVYIGQILGLLLYCDNCKSFKAVKKYVYIVPILGAITTVYFIVKYIKENEWKKLFIYFSINEKHIIILDTMAEVLPAYQKSASRKSHRRKEVILPRVSFLKSFLFETHDRVLDCVQYM